VRNRAIIGFFFLVTTVVTAITQDSVPVGVLLLSTSSDLEGENCCSENVYLDQPVTVHVVIFAYGFGDRFSSVEFSIPDLPQISDSESGEMIEEWFFPVEGSLREGLFMTFPDPPDRFWIPLGSLVFTEHVEGWIGNSSINSEGPAFGWYPEVVFQDGYTDFLGAGLFIFSTDWDGSECSWCYIVPDAVGSSSWSLIKSLY